MTKSAPAPTVLDEARALVAGAGRFERGSAFEPLLVPLVAHHAAPEEVWFTCYVGSLASRPNPRLGWPLLGIAVAREVAPLVSDEVAWDAIQTLPDLVLYLKPELLAPIADRRAHERISRRLGMRRGEPPTLDVKRSLQQPWDASGLVLHFEYAEGPERHADASFVMREVDGSDRMRQLLYRALAASYAGDRATASRSTVALLDADVPGWYWCTLAAHLGLGGDDRSTAHAQRAIPPVWAEHYARLARATDGIDPVALPAEAHPFGHELLALISQMETSDRRDFAREVLNGVVDRWAIDVTLDEVPALFAPLAESAQPSSDATPDTLPLAPPSGPPLAAPAPAPAPAPEAPPVTVVVLSDPWELATEPAPVSDTQPVATPADVPVVVASPAPVDVPADVPAEEAEAAVSAGMSVRVAARDGAGNHVKVTRSFVAGSDHEVLLSLPGDIAGGTPAALTVTLLHDDDRLMRTLPARLVPQGSSTVVPFSLFVRSDERFVLATVTVRRGDVVVAESVLIGDTGTAPDDVADGSIQLRRR